MALSKASLKGRIKTELTAIAASLGIPITDSAQLDKFCEAMANAVVDEIQQNAEVLPGAMLAGGDPVTGTGTVN